MDTVTILRDQAMLTERLASQIFARVTPELAIWKLPDSKANPIAASYLHPYMTEDRVVQSQQGKPSIFEAGGWQSRLGYGPRDIWTMDHCPDLDACRTYAAAVREATVRYLDTLDAADLDREVDLPFGRGPLSALLGLVLSQHKFFHLGEIAALLGCQGEKGFPF